VQLPEGQPASTREISVSSDELPWGDQHSFTCSYERTRRSAEIFWSLFYNPRVWALKHKRVLSGDKSRISELLSRLQEEPQALCKRLFPNLDSPFIKCPGKRDRTGFSTTSAVSGRGTFDFRKWRVGLEGKLMRRLAKGYVGDEAQWKPSLLYKADDKELVTSKKEV